MGFVSNEVRYRPPRRIAGFWFPICRMAMTQRPAMQDRPVCMIRSVMAEHEVTCRRDLAASAGVESQMTCKRPRLAVSDIGARRAELCLMQALIGAAGSDQDIMAAAFDDPPGIDNDNAIGIADRGQSMGNHQSGAAL